MQKAADDWFAGGEG